MDLGSIKTDKFLFKLIKMPWNNTKFSIPLGYIETEKKKIASKAMEMLQIKGCLPCNGVGDVKAKTDI